MLATTGCKDVRSRHSCQQRQQLQTKSRRRGVREGEERGCQSVCSPSEPDLRFGKPCLSPLSSSRSLALKKSTAAAAVHSASSSLHSLTHSLTNSMQDGCVKLFRGSSRCSLSTRKSPNSHGKRSWLPRLVSSGHDGRQRTTTSKQVHISCVCACNRRQPYARTVQRTLPSPSPKQVHFAVMPLAN